MRTPRLRLALLVLSLLAVTACGSQLTRAEIVAANGAGAAPGSTGVGSTPTTATGALDGAAAPEVTSGAANPGGVPTDGASAPAESGGPSGQAAAPGTGLGPATGKPVLLGNLGTYSGPIGSSATGGRDGILLWASYVNDHGGINGRPVKVVVADDGNDPAKALSLAKDMVERQGVVAFVGNTQPLTTSAVANYLRDAKVPVIGGDLIDPVWFTNPYYFPQGGSFEAVVGALVREAKLAGYKRLGVLACTETPLCDLGTQIVADAAARDGLDLVYRAKITLTAPDYTAECLGAQSRDVQMLIMGAEANTMGRIATSCVRQGYRPQLGAVSIGVTDAMRKNADLEGLISAQPNFPWMSKGIPAVDAFRAAIARYAPSLVSSGAAATSWTSGELFRAATAGIGTDLTRATIFQAMGSIQGNDLGGLTTPLTFSPGAPAPANRCYFPIKLHEGEWTAPRGTEAACL